METHMRIVSSLLMLSWLLACTQGKASTPASEEEEGATRGEEVLGAPETGNSPVTAKAQRGWADGRTLDRTSEAPRNVQFIIGGEEVPEGKYPFTVAIAYRNIEGKLTQYCGGSLIGPKTVLTAAHCGVAPGHSVIIDRHNLTTLRGQERTIIGVTIHPSFNGETFQNDIAILRLHRSVEGANIPERYVSLARDGDPLPEGTTVTALGWGQTSHGGNSSLVLRKVSLPVTKQQECSQQYRIRYAIANSMICSQAPGKDTCAGDSGGPLLMEGPGGRWIQVGITSFGIRCAEPDFPGVYTRVASFGRWISDDLVR